MNALLTDEEFVLELAVTLMQVQLDWERDVDHVRFGGRPLHVAQARALLRRVRGETAHEIERRIRSLREASLGDTTEFTEYWRDGLADAEAIARQLDDPDRPPNDRRSP